MSEIEATPPTESSRRRPRALTIGTIILVLAAIVGVLILALSRRGAEARSASSARWRRTPGQWFAWPRWSSPAPSARSASRGEVRAWNQATLYSKVAGYVREVLVDKGAR
jgi:multidrug efflux pump subunit AcrA (membrane-fusion protein)